MLCNAIVNNPEGKEVLWSCFYPDSFMYCYTFFFTRVCLRQFSHSEKIIANTITLLYYCMNQADTVPKEADNLTVLLSNPTLMTLLFSRSFQLVVTSSACEWIDYLVYKILLLISQSNSASLLQSSLQSLSSSESPVASAEQLIFFHLILDCLDSHSGLSVLDK